MKEETKYVCLKWQQVDRVVMVRMGMVDNERWQIELIWSFCIQTKNFEGDNVVYISTLSPSKYRWYVFVWFSFYAIIIIVCKIEKWKPITELNSTQRNCVQRFSAKSWGVQQQSPKGIKLLMWFPQSIMTSSSLLSTEINLRISLRLMSLKSTNIPYKNSFLETVNLLFPYTRHLTML